MTDYKAVGDRELVEAIIRNEQAMESATKDLRRAKDEFLNRKRNEIARAYSAKNSQFGVIHLEHDGYKLDISTSPRVEWDQEKLQSLHREIHSEWKSDPSEFIETKFSVKESKYKA